jgi:lipopolysaccharide biosynthesis glycosyltransferase
MWSESRYGGIHSGAHERGIFATVCLFYIDNELCSTWFMTNIYLCINIQHVNKKKAFSACFPTTNVEVVSFVLPQSSGFFEQLNTEGKRKKKSHWYSETGADMVRFFLASIFPHLPRILYLDNDVIVQCCLEEVWSTDFGEGKAVGIALDDLKWATVTQFHRQVHEKLN